MRTRDGARDFLTCVQSHLDKLLANGTAPFGPDPCGMWMASLDTKTGRYPEDDSRPKHIGKRVYREIDAPKGCTLYWDQPQIVAAHALSRQTGDSRYTEAADAYVEAFLERCVAKSGLFLWGNHYYWDAFRGTVMRFLPLVPCDMATEAGELHEARPIPPAWESFWRVDARAAERAIRAMGEHHLYDPETGGFNRHADKRRAHAFIESGGILAESLAWLSRRNRDPSLADLALRIARSSWSSRGHDTNLVRNSPDHERWDQTTCTTEAGLWAGSLLRCADYTGVEEFASIAREAVLAYLRYGYDEQTDRYWGRLSVDDGRPVLGPKATVYMPDEHADLWAPLFPIHDYPMALAETCVSLFERTSDERFREGISRWAGVVEKNLPANGGKGAYAEHYGRCMHFLTRAAVVLHDEGLNSLAERVAEEAVGLLFTDGMFRGHPGEDRYDAVDGVGFLLLALLYLQTGQEPDGMGFGF